MLWNRRIRLIRATEQWNVLPLWMLHLNLRSMTSVTIYCTQKERPTQIHTADFKDFAKIFIVSLLCFTQMTTLKIHSVTAFNSTWACQWWQHFPPTAFFVLKSSHPEGWTTMQCLCVGSSFFSTMRSWFVPRSSKSFLLEQSPSCHACHWC